VIFSNRSTQAGPFSLTYFALKASRVALIHRGFDPFTASFGDKIAEMLQTLPKQEND